MPLVSRCSSGQGATLPGKVVVMAGSRARTQLETRHMGCGLGTATCCVALSKLPHLWAAEPTYL